MTIKWKSEGEGYWKSDDGRFSISPQYWGRTTAQSYKVRDTHTKKEMSFDRIRECKGWAAQQPEKREE